MIPISKFLFLKKKKSMKLVNPTGLYMKRWKKKKKEELGFSEKLTAQKIHEDSGRNILGPFPTTYGPNDTCTWLSAEIKLICTS